MTSKPLQPFSATTEAPCPHFTPPENPPKTQAPLQPRVTRAHTQELSSLSLIYSTTLSARPALKAVQGTQRAPKTPPRAGTAAKPQPVPFGMNFSELLNIQKRDWPLLGPSLRNSWPSPLPHLPHVT